MFFGTFRTYRILPNKGVFQMKRMLSAVLAGLMLTALLPAAALAAKLPTKDEAAQVLAALNIMTGNENGDLMLQKSVTRAEFTKLVVASAPFGDGVGAATSTSPYPDVPRGHWAAGYIQAAVDHSLVRGDLYGRFNPSKTITLAEGVTMVLRLLGYQDSDYSGAYPTGQLALYQSLKLNQGVTATSPNAPLTRGDCLYLFFNLLTVKTKEGVVYLDVLKPKDQLVTPSEEIDTVALVNSAMDGPVVASSSWSAKIPFNVSSATVYRSGQRSNLEAIVANDVIYWSKSTQSLWVYNNRISGSIQSVTPSSAPTSIVLAGKTYAIETTAAAYDLSDLGSYKVGDTVTLLLGRDNGVVSVLSSTATQQPGDDICGLITQVTKEPYEDAAGKSYAATTIHVTATDGNSYSYRWDNNSVRPGALVRVTTVNGRVEIKTLANSGLSGKVSSDGKRLGTYNLAEGVEILDTYGDKAVRVYPARIANITLEGSNVRSYLLNSQGDISKLVLNDVTGDMHQYGILTSAIQTATAAGDVWSYAYDVAGITGSIPQSTKSFRVETGPFLMKTNGTDTDRMVNLTALSITNVKDRVVVANNQEYTVSEQAAVYELRDGNYFLTTLEAVSDGSYSLSGWYDKPESDGGRIRVIIAAQ